MLLINILRLVQRVIMNITIYLLIIGVIIYFAISNFIDIILNKQY